ncbi:MAG TPA: pyridoxal phosphate-dependent aminotransferase [bacterium]|nr:pyridoxal phosphate-dependent aminotransferase [bacterium]
MKSPDISLRGKSTPESPIRKLAVHADAAKAHGVHIYHLNIGQPDIPTPNEFFQALQSFEQKVLAYGPSNGLPEFLKTMADYYRKNGIEVEPKDCMISTAGSEAVLFAMMAAASPGDEIIVPEPFYPNYNGFAHMAGIRLIPVGTDPENGYRLPSIQKLEQCLTTRSRAIIICSPNNPTGTVLTREEMKIVADFALHNQLFVLSDEVYREFCFSGKHVSIMEFSEISENAILVDSLSKRYSACGARVGCIVSKNKEIMKTVLKFGQARLCPPTLEQIGAMALVKTGERYFSDMLEEYRERRDTLFQRLSKIQGVKCVKPEGAFYMMVTFPVKDIEDFCRWMLTDFHDQNETVMIAPGPGFYATPGRGMREARIAYVLNSQALNRSMDILEKGLNAYPG